MVDWKPLPDIGSEGCHLISSHHSACEVNDNFSASRDCAAEHGGAPGFGLLASYCGHVCVFTQKMKCMRSARDEVQVGVTFLPYLRRHLRVRWAKSR